MRLDKPPLHIRQIRLVSCRATAMLFAGGRGLHDNLQETRNSLESSEPRPLNPFRNGLSHNLRFKLNRPNEMRRLTMRFNRILRSKRSETLDPWIDDAIDSDIISIMRFARVLRRDIDAVHNAIELPWSNGQAEGQINRLETLKRAMSGRAGPELLRARMLPPRHTYEKEPH